MSARPYTAEDDEVIVADMLAGVPQHETAVKLGRTACAIHVRRTKLRKTTPGLPAAFRPVPRVRPPDAALKKRVRQARLPHRACNTCPSVFQPTSPYQRFCESCRRGLVRDTAWTVGL